MAEQPTYRTGNHHGVTIVRETPIDGMTAVHAELVAVVTNQDQALAERICALLNGDVGPCSSSLPYFLDGVMTTACELRHGHTGDHQADNGLTRWREIKP